MFLKIDLHVEHSSQDKKQTSLKRCSHLMGRGGDFELNAYALPPWGLLNTLGGVGGSSTCSVEDTLLFPGEEEEEQ